MESIAWISIGVALACGLWIAFDEVRYPQPMAVMNVVWPLTALYFSVFAVWAYVRLGRSKALAARSGGEGMSVESDDDGRVKSPNLSQVAIGASHCGAGCMLADVFCEFGIAVVGITILGSVLWAEFAIDFIAAWILGVAFQYFAIKPMSALKPPQAIVAAIKADTLSILAFQVGMYAWMAFVFFRLFPGPHLTPFQPQYWLMMQVGMICGFVTTLPMNWLLIRSGFKEAM